jgi:hypothetical protein
MFTICVLLGNRSPEISNKKLALQLGRKFRNDRGFSIKSSTNPFINVEALNLSWNNWHVMVAYEAGEIALEDASAIRKYLSGRPELARIDWARRIRVNIGSDDNKTHTEQILDVMEFFSMIPDVTLFDPQRRAISDFSRELVTQTTPLTPQKTPRAKRGARRNSP